MTEVRYKDPKTGGEKGEKIERYDLIPAHALEEVARVYGKGSIKYSANNWTKGYPWHLALAALHRHIKEFEKGESLDPELGTHHLAHAVFHLLSLMTFEKFGLGTDDRSKLGRKE